MASLVRRAREAARKARRHGDLLGFCVLHTVHDGFVAGFYPLLPLLASDLGLTYGEAGFLKFCLSAAGGALQLPAGLLIERLGERLVVASGSLWLAMTYGLLALGAALPQLAATAALAGVGSSPQHVGPAAFVSRVYDARSRGTALGLWNFSGDLGKGLLPAIGGLIAALAGWRVAIVALAAAGGLVALTQLWRWQAARRQAELRLAPTGGSSTTWDLGERSRFTATVLLGVLDTATRDGALLLLPFLLATAGFSPPAIGALFALLFACGAAAKFVCGPLTDRYGAVAVIILTEVGTVALLPGLVVASPFLIVPLLALFGMAMSGTSSALFDLVAHHVRADTRARGYGVYYSFTQATTALAPMLYGMLADAAGLRSALLVMAGVTLTTLPLAWVARPSPSRWG